MGREKLKSFFGGTGTENPPPLGSSSASRATTSQPPTIRPNLSSQNVASLTASAVDNPALQKALTTFVGTIPDNEKQRYTLAASQAPIQPSDIIEHVQRLNKKHEQGSVLHQKADQTTTFLAVIDRFAKLIAAVAQSNQIAGLVVGAVRVIVEVFSSFASFFTRLSDMFDKLGKQVDALLPYLSSTSQNATIYDILQIIYVDMLNLCRKGNAIFLDQDGKPKQRISWRIFWRQLWIPFEDEFGDVEADFQFHIKLLDQYAQAQDLVNTYELLRSEKERRTREQAKTREDFLFWLSDLSFEEVQDMMFSKKHRGTANWVLHEPSFSAWRRSSQSEIIWCHGKAGAGKSVIAANVIENLTAFAAGNGDIALAFIYHNYRKDNTHDVKNVLRALIKQLCRQRSEIPSAFLKVKSDATSPNELGDIESFFEASRSFREVYLVIDALDECPNDEREDMFDFISVVTTRKQPVKVFVTSRYEADIKDFFSSQWARTIECESSSTSKDISCYITEQVEILRHKDYGQRLRVQSEIGAKKIVDELTLGADGMFLWVTLQLQYLCKFKKEAEILSALSQVSQGLESTYDRMLQRIQVSTSIERGLAVRVLRHVVPAVAILDWSKLNSALAIDGDGQPGAPYFTVEEMIEACQGLLEHTKEEGIKLIHLSAQEFLLRQPGLFGEQSQISPTVLLQNLHAQMAKQCMTILEMIGEDGNGSTAWQAYGDFLFYATKRFAEHLWRSGTDHSRPAELIEHFKGLMLNHSNAFYTELWTGREYFRSKESDDVKQNLGNAVFLTFDRLWDIPDVNDLLTSLPVTAAAFWQVCKNGDDDLALRLSMGVDNIDIVADGSGGTALHAAASHCRLRTVMAFVSAGADVNHRNTAGHTPLFAAACNGRLENMKYLLEQGAVIHDALFFQLEGHFIEGDDLLYGTTPAVQIYELLLDYGADINARLEGNRPLLPLICCNEKSSGSLVPFLISKGIDIDARGEDGSAVEVACDIGSDRLLKILLDAGANVDLTPSDDEKVGPYFDHPLQLAAKSASCAAEKIKLLIDNGVDVNSSVVRGGYDHVLHTAVLGGCAEVAKTLLARGVDVDVRVDPHGTALTRLLLMQNSNNMILSHSVDLERTVRLLLDAGADPNAKADQGLGTTFLSAITYGDAEIVRMFLATKANVSEQRSGCRTPLNLARYQLIKNTLQADQWGSGASNLHHADFDSRMSSRASIITMLQDHGALDDGADFEDALEGHTKYTIRALARFWPDSGGMELDERIEYWKSRVTLKEPEQSRGLATRTTSGPKTFTILG